MHFILSASIFVVLALQLLGLGALWPRPLQAGPVSDQLMAPGLFSQAAPGLVASYSLRRELAEQPKEGWPGQGRGIMLPEALEAAELSLRKPYEGQGSTIIPLELVLTKTAHTDAGADHSLERVLAELSGAGPNPILLFWLENIVRSAAVQTGGSPYYLRNRIREALVGAQIPQPSPEGLYELALTPFSGQSKERLGAFGGLRMVILWDGADPSKIIELKAETAGQTQEDGLADLEGGGSYAGGYREHLVLKEREK